jgi:ribosomal protein S18 acetylase RimI-like enzyme
MTHVREMTIGDYESVVALMQETPGVTVRDADSREATERYLARNPGFSFVAEDQGRVVGCVFCGHDGRRGYLQHLTVAPSYRNRRIAQSLVSRCLERLEAVGITKTHIDVLIKNESAIDYWKKRGWKKRDDICRFSFNRSGSENA